MLHKFVCQLLVVSNESVGLFFLFFVVVVQEQGGSGTISRIFLCINGGTIVWVNDQILCPKIPLFLLHSTSYIWEQFFLVISILLFKYLPLTLGNLNFIHVLPKIKYHFGLHNLKFILF